MHDKAAQLVVPELHCPVTPAISPHAGKLNLRVARWTRAGELHSPARQPHGPTRSDLGAFVARVCPDADPDRLTLYAQWLAFCFFYDDEFFGDEAESGEDGSGEDVIRRARRRSAADAAMAAVSALVPGGMPSGLPRLPEITRLHRLDVLTDLLARTASVARPDQFSRFGTDLTLWFSSRVQDGSAPSGHIAFAPCLTLAEIVTGIPVSSRKLASGDLRRLIELAAVRTAWCDRLHAAARQRSVAGLIAELPPLLRNSAERSPQRAMDQAARVCDETMRDYLRLEHAVLAGAAPAVRDYLSLVRTLMRAHSDWLRATLRHDSGFTATGADPEPVSGFDVRIVLRTDRWTERENTVGAD